MNKKQNKEPDKQIANNKKAFHDYFIEEKFEAGLVLQGWEVKSLREGRVNLKDCYVIIKNNEAWLIGAHISPLPTASKHIEPDPTRSRKLLLHQKEIGRLIGAKEREGYTIVALDFHWWKNRAKANIAIAKGKKQYDKREVEKRRDWTREKQRLLKH